MQGLREAQTNGSSKELGGTQDVVDASISAVGDSSCVYNRLRERTLEVQELSMKVDELQSKNDELELLLKALGAASPPLETFDKDVLDQQLARVAARPI